MADSPEDPVGEGDAVRGSVAVDEKVVGEAVGGSPVVTGVVEEGEANSPGSVADEGDIVGESVGGRGDWASNMTAAKSRSPRCEPFHTPITSPATRRRPVLSATTSLSAS